MKQFTSKTQKIGEIGENTACKFLMKHGFKIIERNYTKKWGEIDIIAKKFSKIYFFEVKTLSFPDIELVSQETLNSTYRPEDNINDLKIKRLSRAIQTYILDRKVSGETKWQFDLITVYLDLAKKKAKVGRIEDIIL